MSPELAERPNTLVASHREYYNRPEVRAEVRLQDKGTDSTAAWFLGPKAENEDLLRELINAAITLHVERRHTAYPHDPPFNAKADPDYQATTEAMRTYTRDFLEKLTHSVPFFSMRYIGHMNWDTTLPSLVGYFGAMLYNQNNVALEASPYTTELELEVGKDLCRMLGFRVPDDPGVDDILPWSHITCDGTVANMEALWSARNLKFFPITLKLAIEKEDDLAAARKIKVPLLNGDMEYLLNLDPWTLINLKADDVLAIPQQLKGEYGIPLDVTTKALSKYSIQTLGFEEFRRRYLPADIGPVTAITPATRHYSWPKSGAVLGFGADNVLKVPVDIDCRMDIDALRKQLQLCWDESRPVALVVAVMGSTEESAVDNLTGILALRDEFNKVGFNFNVHVDAAWGGYFASMFRQDERQVGLAAAAAPPILLEVPMAEWVQKQFQAIPLADSVTVDPHKAGFVPYPAGSLTYRNGAMRDLVTFTAPYVNHDEVEPTVGPYGIEGSKPGAAAAAVYLSHKVLRPTQRGYGKLLRQCMFTAKKLYSRLVSMEDDQFRMVCLQRLPAEKQGLSKEIVEQQKRRLHDIALQPNEKLQQDPAALALLREVGPDLLIMPYMVIPKNPDGSPVDADRVNKVNLNVFNLLKMDLEHPEKLPELMITQSTFEKDSYGEEFLVAIAKRAGIVRKPGTPLNFLISTVQDPWATDTAAGDFLQTIEAALTRAIHVALKM